MGKGLNKAQIIGNVGQDPEVRSTQSGAKVVNLSIATTESWTGKDGQKQEQTEWHRVFFFGKPAEIIEQYVRKGSRMYVEGSLQTRKWQDKDSSDRYTTEIKGRDFLLLGGDSERSSGGSGGRSSAPYQQPAPSQIGDEDIPF